MTVLSPFSSLRHRTSCGIVRPAAPLKVRTLPLCGGRTTAEQQILGRASRPSQERAGFSLELAARRARYPHPRDAIEIEHAGQASRVAVRGRVRPSARSSDRCQQGEQHNGLDHVHPGIKRGPSHRR